MEDDKQSNFPEAGSGDQEIIQMSEVDDSLLGSFGQLALHDQIANDINQVQVALMIPDAKWEKIQRHLVLCLHANRCIKREELCSGPYDCSLPHCSRIKSILLHINTCLTENECLTPLCSSTKKIIGHWEFCQRENCPVCWPIRIADRINNVSCSRTTLNFRRDEVSANRASTSTSASAGAGAEYSSEFNMLPLLPFTDSNLFVRQGFFIDSNFEHLLPQGFALEPLLATKSWHHLMSVNCRHEQIRLLVTRVLPFCNENSISERMVDNLMTYAGFLEIDAYRAADSKNEYLELLKEHTYKMIEKIDEEKRKLSEKN